MYFDGKNLHKLVQLCGREEADAISARYIEGELVILCTDYAADDIYSPMTSIYVYNNDGTVKEIVEKMKAYYQGTQSDGLSVSGRYGFYYIDGRLNVLDILENTSVATEYSLGQISSIYNIKAIEQELLGIVLRDGHIAMIDATNGET